MQPTKNSKMFNVACGQKSGQTWWTTWNTKDQIYSYKLLFVYKSRSGVGRVFCSFPIYINKQHDAKHQRELATVDWSVELPS